jgi:rubrerythrin
MSSPESSVDFNDEMKDLTLSLGKEKECREFYSASAEKVSDPGLQAVYKWLAGVGEKRIELLEGIQRSAEESQAWSSGMDDRARAVDAALGQAPSLEGQSIGKPGKAEIITLRQGITLEKESASISYTAARRSREPNIHSLWGYLAETEEMHKKLLEAYFEGYIAAVTRKN